MLLQQISCDSAVECAQIANTQETLVLNGIVFVLFLVVVWQLMRLYQHSGLEG